MAGTPTLGRAPQDGSEEDGPSGSVRRERPSWSITKSAATGTIVMRFVGPTRTSEVPEFLAAITDMMPDENANLIFDLRELVGHNPETKQPIKKWLIEHKSRIDQITVVVPKAAAILKMATAVIGLASGLKIKVRDDVDVGVSAAKL